MLKKKVFDSLNSQVNAEMYSAYLYLSMSTWFEAKSLPGFVNWMRCQAQEEMVHGMMIFDHLHERGAKVELQAIAAPPTKWETPLNVFEEVYKHECKVTGLIDGLVSLAAEEKDHATHSFLQWFVDEQVEEESSADDVVQKLRLIGKDSSGLFMLDAELAKRVFAPPPKYAPGGTAVV